MDIGVLLAAGASKRMGHPKALADWKGQSFLVRGVRALWTTCDVVVVVLGAHGARIRSGAEQEFARLVEGGALAGDLRSPGSRTPRRLEVRFEDNARWKSGMLSSARVGLAAALRLRPRGLFVLPVDHPQVKAQTVRQLSDVMREALGAFGSAAPRTFPYALVPRHAGRRGHPLALSVSLARAIVRDRRATDLGDAVRRNTRLVGYLDVRDPGILLNRNTPRG